MTVALAQEPFTPLGDALARLDAAISPLVGIVTQVTRTMHMPDEARLPNLACRLGSALRTLGAPTVEYGGGAHPDPRRARAAAIGEAIERYSGTFVPFERLVLATSGELGDEAVPPERFSLFHPAQLAQPKFPFAVFTDETRLHFAQGASLADGTPAWLPAQLVYLRPAGLDRCPIGYPTSSGLACGPTQAEATLGALLELVERDAVMLTWKCRLSLPLLDWSENEELRAYDDRYFAPTGLRYTVVDGSCFLGVPLAIALVRGPAGSGAALAVGAGCAATVEDAWLKALSEGFGVYRWLRQEAAAAPDRPRLAADDVQAFDDHMRFYAHEETAHLAEFLWTSDEQRPVSDVASLEGTTPSAQIGAVVSRLGRAGASAYAVDVTSPDVRALGLHVVRAIAPELCALDVWHTARYLGGPRLYHAAHEAGLATTPTTIEDVNPDPHPFP